MSALFSLAALRMSCHGTITPRSMTSKPLHWRTTPTMFLPMSWTSPLTVAMTILPLGLRRRSSLLRLDVGQQVGDRLLHHARRFHHLRQEHLARAEQVADHVHAVHQRALRSPRSAARLQARLLGVVDDEGVDALDQRMLQPLLDRPAAPFGVLLLGDRVGALVLSASVEQPLGARRRVRLRITSSQASRSSGSIWS